MVAGCVRKHCHLKPTNGIAPKRGARHSQDFQRCQRLKNIFLQRGDAVCLEVPFGGRNVCVCMYVKCMKTGHLHKLSAQRNESVRATSETVNKPKRRRHPPLEIATTNSQFCNGRQGPRNIPVRKGPQVVVGDVPLCQSGQGRGVDIEKKTRPLVNVRVLRQALVEHTPVSPSFP